LVKAGFNENNLKNGISAIVGVRAQFQQIPTGKTRTDKNGKEWPDTRTAVVGTIDGASKAATVKTAVGTAATAAPTVGTAATPADLRKAAKEFIYNLVETDTKWAATEVGSSIKVALPLIKARIAKFLNVPAYASIAATDRPKVAALLGDETFLAELAAEGVVSYNPATSEFTKLV
jgi:hypothetical protein